MMKTRNGLLMSALALAGFGLGLAGCTGSTDGGSQGEKDFSETQFIADDTVGSIELIPNETNLEIGEETGFFVVARDARGNGVPFINIACDSEAGVAILEPTTGVEATGADGRMSGRIGCELPGSHLFGCRLPIGANKRQFVTIICEGEVPPGFEGFPGAGGGGLGGGVQVDPDNDNIEEVRITAIAADDEGGTTLGGEGGGTTSIDVRQSLCLEGGTGTPEAEPFFDTLITVKVLNNTDVPVSFRTLTYSVDNADGQGTQFNSKPLAVLTDTIAANGGEATYTTLVFNASNGRKFFADSTFPIPDNLGFRNITFRLFGENALGEQITLTARTTLSFGTFDRCDSAT